MAEPAQSRTRDGRSGVVRYVVHTTYDPKMDERMPCGRLPAWCGCFIEFFVLWRSSALAIIVLDRVLRGITWTRSTTASRIRETLPPRWCSRWCSAC